MYKVLLQRELTDRYVIVEAESIAAAERATGGIVVALAEHHVEPEPGL